MDNNFTEIIYKDGQIWIPTYSPIQSTDVWDRYTVDKAVFSKLPMKPYSRNAEYSTVCHIGQSSRVAGGVCGSCINAWAKEDDYLCEGCRAT